MDVHGSRRFGPAGPQPLQRFAAASSSPEYFSYQPALSNHSSTPVTLFGPVPTLTAVRGSQYVPQESHLNHSALQAFSQPTFSTVLSEYWDFTTLYGETQPSSIYHDVESDPPGEASNRQSTAFIPARQMSS